MAKDDIQTVLAEVRSVKGMVINQGKILKDHEKRLSQIDQDKKLAAAVQAGIDEYKKNEMAKKNDNAVSEYNQTKLKLLRDLAPFIVAAAALIYAVASRYK